MNDTWITLIIVLALIMPMIVAFSYLKHRIKGSVGAFPNQEHEKFSDFVTSLVPHNEPEEDYAWITLAEVLDRCLRIDVLMKHFESNGCDTPEKRRSAILFCLLRVANFKKEYCIIDQSKGMSEQEWREVFLPKTGSEDVIEHFIDISKDGEVNFRFKRNPL